MPARTALAAAALLVAAAASADHITLKNGLRIDGEPLQRPGVTVGLSKTRRDGVYPLYTVEDGVRRYYFSKSLADRDAVVYDQNIGQVQFELETRVRRSDYEPESVGAVDQTVPFNSDGKRVVRVTTNRGPFDLTQGASFVTPGHVEIETLNFDWHYGLLTSELTDESLLGLLSAGVKGGEATDQLRRVQFLIQAGRFETARSELAHVREAYPELESQARRFDEELPKLYGYKAMREINHLRDAGRHGAAQFYCRQLTPGEAAPTTVSEAEAILQEYENLVAAKDEALFAMATLEGELPEEQAALVRPLRNTLEDELHVATFDRLGPFRKVADVEGIEPAAKLALAYSAWVAGPAFASEDLSHAFDLWTFREAALRLLRSENEYVFEDRLAPALEVEGVTAAEAAAAMPLLPPVRRTDVPEGGLLELTARDGTDYLVQLPPEYHPAHRYPAVLALHGTGMKAADELGWWLGGQGPLSLAAKRGVIVIAPRYRDRTDPTPGEVETRLMAVLRDARARFGVDSDRVVLGGHFGGGDFVFEVGFCRPDVWAGIVPVGGRCTPLASQARRNAEGLPVYCVLGGFDKLTFDTVAVPLDDLMLDRNPVVLCEYVNRGRESFRGEVERIYDWMLLQRRQPLDGKVDRTVFTDAPLDNGLLRTGPLPARPGEPPRPQRVSADLTSSNRLRVNTRGRPAEVWLNDAVVEFGKRMPVEFGSRAKPSQIPEPSVEAVLRDFHARSDRQRLFSYRLPLD